MTDNRTPDALDRACEAYRDDLYGDTTLQLSPSERGAIAAALRVMADDIRAPSACPRHRHVRPHRLPAVAAGPGRCGRRLPVGDRMIQSRYLVGYHDGSKDAMDYAITQDVVDAYNAGYGDADQLRSILTDLIGHLRDMFGDGIPTGEAWNKWDVASVTAEVTGYLDTAEARLREVTT